MLYIGGMLKAMYKKYKYNVRHMCKRKFDCIYLSQSTYKSLINKLHKYFCIQNLYLAFTNIKQQH